MPQPNPYLRGRRVNLHVLEENDAPQLCAWFNDEELRRFIQTHPPMNEAEERAWLRKLPERKDTDRVFALVTAEGKFIGTMGLHGINRTNQTARTGTLVGDKEHWSKGYGTEAKMLLLDYAFNELNLRRIVTMVHATNPRSLRCQEKCGYEREGVLRQEAFKNGVFVDVVLLAVFRKNWLPLWEKFKAEHLAQP